jgi:DNA replication and repair protein RecF
MSLGQLSLRNVRRLAEADIELSPRSNLIYGQNGSGKTSCLEAIYLLGRGRSFRTRNTERLIRHGERDLIVFGRTRAEPPTLLGVQAEDEARLEAFVGQVGQIRSQLVVTSLSADRAPFGRPEGVFHVEQGRVRPV